MEKYFNLPLQTGASYGIKKTTGKTPIGHALNYVKKNKLLKKKTLVHLLLKKKTLEICLMVEKKIISKQRTKKKSFNNPQKISLLLYNLP